jgi:dTMP kinase
MSTTSRCGLFLTFEGLDGCGKTTQMRLLADRLRQEGETVIETVEPGGTAIGTAIRSILLDPANQHLSSSAEMLLYFAARAQNVDEILTPAIARGEIVISDRWTDSTWAYQGFGRNLGTAVIRSLDSIACRGRRPDLTLWVDIDLETSLDRAHARNRDRAASGATRDTRMDDQSCAFFERVLQGYQSLAEAEPDRVARIDGRGSVAEVAARIDQAYRHFRSRHA